MRHSLAAHFDGKVIVPDEPVQLPVGHPLRVHVEVASSSTGPSPQDGHGQPASGPPSRFSRLAQAAERSQGAFLRDLPRMLTDSKLVGKWVLYREGKRVAVARSQRQLIQKCQREGWTSGEYYVDMVIPHVSEPEVVDAPLLEVEEARADGTPEPSA